MTRRLVSDDERRARLGRRHRLAAPAPPTLDPSADIAAVVDDLVVLHASDPATIYLSVSARRPGVTPDQIDEALFDDRVLLRTLAMRRTLFVVTGATAAVVEASSSATVAATERKRLVGFMADSGIDGPHQWLDEVFAEVLDALAHDEAVSHGLTARELSDAVPRLATTVVVGLGTSHETDVRLTSRVLGLMAVDGLLIRGRPVGGWTNRLYRWHRRDRWWPEGQGPAGDPTEEEASAALVERYLRTFGPATSADVVWWTGWTRGKTRKALAQLDVVEVELEGPDSNGPGLLLAIDAEAVEAPEHWAALLPALDPTPMGWKQRAWYLGRHQGPLFDRNGNIGPTVWVDGRIVGGWAQRPDGGLVVELLEDVDPRHRALIEAERTRTATFVDGVVVKPSFPTPLQRQLSTA